MSPTNQINMSLKNLSENVAIARVAAAAFAAQVELTLNDVEEIKVAVSEAVSNAIIHGYGPEIYKGKECMVEFIMTLFDDKIQFEVIDYGIGIADIAQARQPSFSTDPERMGLGFVFMESFMDELEIDSVLNKGTKIRMAKKIESSKVH